MCRTFEHKLRGDIFELFTHFERSVIDMWSLTINGKVVETHQIKYNCIDKLVVKACVLFRNERCLRRPLPCSTN